MEIKKITDRTQIPAITDNTLLVVDNGTAGFKAKASQLRDYVRPYKVYTAFFLNSEGSAFAGPELLEVGKIYAVRNLEPGDDFTNVGGVNTEGTEFVATGTTPAVWTASVIVEVLDPIVTVLQNELGAIAWARIAKGIYSGTLANAFPQGKTLVFITANASTATAVMARNDADSVLVATADSTGVVLTDNNLTGDSFIEIRVYN